MSKARELDTIFLCHSIGNDEYEDEFIRYSDYKKIEQAADKLAEYLELAIAGIKGANVDLRFLENRLKEYRGSDE